MYDSGRAYAIVVLVILATTSCFTLTFGQVVQPQCLDSTTHKPQATAEDELFGEVNPLLIRSLYFE